MKIILPLMLFVCYCVNISAAGDNPAASSALSSGQWFKIAVTADGVYRIDYTQLKQLGITNPALTRLFGNNNGQLSYYNDGSAPDDLKEIAIYQATGTDGIFNEGDYILFYGQGTKRWIFDPVSKGYSALRHNYSDTAYYFLTSGTQAKAIRSYQPPSESPGYTSVYSDALFLHEKETDNLLKSGRDWFQPVSAQSPLKISPGFTNMLLTEGIKMKIRVAARSANGANFRVVENSSTLKNIVTQPVNLFNYTGTYASTADSATTFFPAASLATLEIRFDNKGDQGAKGWIDYVMLHARVTSTFEGPQKQLMDGSSVEPGRTTEFRINSPVNNAVIWDVTDATDPMIINFVKADNTISYKSRTESLRTFIAFTPETVLRPVVLPAQVPNQDLHASAAADMIIVTNPIFAPYAQKLAEMHQRQSGLSSLIVTPGQIYNEFSGGIRDIAAIRNFIRMKYLKQQGTSRPLRYLLLFGDGSYDNRKMPPGNPAFIPTYQSQNSNVVVSSFTSDDFFGLLEDGEGEAEGTEDIGIGRLPVSDTSQARSVIYKIERYTSEANTGEWKNIITLVADDEDGNAHMTDAEGLEDVLKENVPEYNIQKIYLDSYRQVSSVNGQSYPEVNKAINDRISKGCLIFNYTGHGSENGLAHERIVTVEDIKSWKNGSRLPLFITATCEFSRFDDIEINPVTGDRTDKPSAGELAFRNSNGGCIALMSTTRLVFSAPNYFLNRNIMNRIFEKDNKNEPIRLGDIIRKAKNDSGAGANKRNFSLLGDPALVLSYPWHGKVITDSLNNSVISAGADSLKALSMVTVSGHINDSQGRLMNDFNGVVSPVVFDKESKVRTLANDGGPVMEFYMMNNVIFSGQTKARNGIFHFSFIVPRDINYSYGNGKISYYAFDAERDMNGSAGNIVVGGFSGKAVTDNSGPDIRLFMNDTLFRSGGMTDDRPVLFALIEDKGGINTTGAGIGHDLTAFLDNDRNNSFNLNQYYVNDFDKFSRGSISYQLTDLSKGTHSITLKAWDNYNNSSEETLLFVVEDNAKLILRNLINYPNPFTERTTITAEINKPEENLEIVLRIFNVNGTLISTITNKVRASGYTLPAIEWDCKVNGARVARGLYPYVVSVRSSTGETTRASGRMIIL
ncbi:MAG TPA: type IX secretion system sortase PorU [Bacteroidales bacterium]|nr:type IX secretion system sortase PorU [Bacteroidales bacterium]